jgi:hypothetical protein
MGYWSGAAFGGDLYQPWKNPPFILLLTYFKGKTKLKVE